MNVGGGGPGGNMMAMNMQVSIWKIMLKKIIAVGSDDQGILELMKMLFFLFVFQQMYGRQR